MMKHTITAFLVSLGLAATAQAEWKFGLGAGLGPFDIDGDISTPGASRDIEYDVGDLEAAFGLSGYAATGNWIIKASGSYLDLEGDQGALADVKFERTNLETTVGYTFYNENKLKLGAFAGLKLVDIEIGAGLFDDDFTDAVVGLTASYMLAEQWSWDSAIDASFGDSEGTYGVQSGVTYRFAPQWTTSALLSWETWEYESGNASLDADEIKLGLAVMYHF